jgi:hypothetical protein
MNRKQRVLTVIALVAFVLIGACHYLAWPPLDLWKTHGLVVTEWEELTWEEAKGKQIKGFNGAVFSD